MPPRSGPITSGSLHPDWGCSMSANTGPARPSAHSTAPSTSTWTCSVARVEAAAAAPSRSGRASRPTGSRLRLEHPPPGRGVDQHTAREWTDHRRDAAPSGPRADRTPAFGLGERRPRSWRGCSAPAALPPPPAAPAPRSGSRRSARLRTATRSDPNRPAPSANTRRRPTGRSSEPPIRISEPSVSRYASTIHCWLGEAIVSRSWRIAGSATFTTVPSMKTIAEPRMHATSVSRFSRSLTGRPSSAKRYRAFQGRPFVIRMRALETLGGIDELAPHWRRRGRRARIRCNFCRPGQGRDDASSRREDLRLDRRSDHAVGSDAHLQGPVDYDRLVLDYDDYGATSSGSVTRRRSAATSATQATIATPPTRAGTPTTPPTSASRGVAASTPWGEALRGFFLQKMLAAAMDRT